MAPTSRSEFPSRGTGPRQGCRPSMSRDRDVGGTRPGPTRLGPCRQSRQRRRQLTLGPFSHFVFHTFYGPSPIWLRVRVSGPARVCRFFTTGSENPHKFHTKDTNYLQDRTRHRHTIRAASHPRNDPDRLDNGRRTRTVTHSGRGSRRGGAGGDDRRQERDRKDLNLRLTTTGLVEPKVLVLLPLILGLGL